MNRDEARREHNPVLWQEVRARLARIKMALAIRDVNRLAVDTRPNLIEQTLLHDASQKNGKEVRDVRLR